MPIYEYKCKNCGNELEELQSISEPPLLECPKCGKPALVRLIGTGSGVIFKGSGFYHTDYKKSTSGKLKTSSESKKETKTENKTDSKSTTTPEKTGKTESKKN